MARLGDEYARERTKGDPQAARRSGPNQREPNRGPVSFGSFRIVRLERRGPCAHGRDPGRNFGGPRTMSIGKFVINNTFVRVLLQI